MPFLPSLGPTSHLGPQYSDGGLPASKASSSQAMRVRSTCPPTRHRIRTRDKGDIRGGSTAGAPVPKPRALPGGPPGRWRTCARRRGGADAAQLLQAVHLARCREEDIVESDGRQGFQPIRLPRLPRTLLDGHVILI